MKRIILLALLQMVLQYH